jgi:ABC-2 type transport system ATP-binding protein
MNIIETENVTKKFSDVVALDKVSLHVRQGEIYGFLGLNGAGKTTAIRLLLGMIKADAGSVFLFGHQIKQASEYWNDVGYMVETSYSYPDLTVSENLEVVYRLRGLKDRACIDTVINVLQLTQYKNRKARHLSMGNNQRLGLAKALIHRPKLLVLDEPINGLDPAGIVEIREFLSDLVQNNGTTIFLSSHILSEIAKISTRIGIVHQGRLVNEINVHELDSRVGKKLCLSTSDNRKAAAILASNGYPTSVTNTNVIELNDQNAVCHPEVIATVLVHAEVPPTMLHVVEEDLESYFLGIIHTDDGEVS